MLLRIAALALVAALALFGSLPVSAQQRPAAAPGAMPAQPMTPGASAQPMTPGTIPGAPSPTAVPANAAPTGMGLCQCISDRTTIRLMCLGSADACQAGCGNTTHYSFVPDAFESCGGKH